MHSCVTHESLMSTSTPVSETRIANLYQDHQFIQLPLEFCQSETSNEVSYVNSLFNTSINSSNKNET